jgi:hypothetical protein
MKRLNYLLMGAVLASCAAMRVGRPQFEGLSEIDRQLVLKWLHLDCGAEQMLTLESQLKAAGARLEPVFWEAYRLGPTTEELAVDRAAISKRFDSRQEYLRTSGTELMTEEDVQQLLSTPRAEYVDAELQRTVVGYQTAAITALAVIGTNESIPELERIAEDDRNPAQTAAREALKRLR